MADFTKSVTLNKGLVTAVLGGNFDTNTGLAANSDLLVSSQKAVKTYVDSSIAGLGTASTLDFDTDDTLAADSDALLPTQQAVKAYVDAAVDVSIGDTITSGTAGRVLFLGAANVLDDDAGLTYTAGGALSVASGTSTAVFGTTGDIAGIFTTGDYIAVLGAENTYNCAAQFNDAARQVQICNGTDNITYGPGDAGDWPVTVTDVWIALDIQAAITAAITTAARTVLDDTTVAAMIDTLGGASSTGSGGLVRATSPTIAASLTVSGTTPITIGELSSSNRADIFLSDLTSAIRVIGGNDIGNAAAIQVWGDSSAFPGVVNIDSGTHDSAVIQFRTAGTGGTKTVRGTVDASGFWTLGSLGAGPWPYAGSGTTYAFLGNSGYDQTDPLNYGIVFGPPGASAGTYINTPTGSLAFRIANTNYLTISTTQAQLEVSLNVTGRIIERMGSSSSNMTEVGTADVQTSAAGIGNTAATTDDTLFTYSLPTNAFSAAAKGVRITAYFHFASNGNNKTAKYWVGGTTVATTGVLTSNNIDGAIVLDVVEIDSTHVSVGGRLLINGMNPIILNTPNLVVSNLTSNATVMKLTGASPTTGAANDVLGYSMRVEFFN